MTEAEKNELLHGTAPECEQNNTEAEETVTAPELCLQDENTENESTEPETSEETPDEEAENGTEVEAESEKEPPRAILFAGVNGAGKTSLYQVMALTEPLGERISIDDIVKENGSWQDYLLQIKAAKLAIEQMQKCIKDRISFHHETTLPGMIIHKQLEKCRAAGYRVILYYVGIDGYQTAIDRVHRRVERGGHGIDDRAIIQRYNNMPGNLRRILPLCDEAYFYDNTFRFRQIAIHRDGEILDEDPILPNWYQSIFTGHTIPDPFIE